MTALRECRWSTDVSVGLGRVKKGTWQKRLRCPVRRRCVRLGFEAIKRNGVNDWCVCYVVATWEREKFLKNVVEKFRYLERMDIDGNEGVLKVKMSLCRNKFDCP